MQSIRILGIAAVLGTLAACSGNNAANNVDANATVEENLEAGLNTTDLNATTDVNATDLNATNSVDANVSDNATSNAL